MQTIWRSAPLAILLLGCAAPVSSDNSGDTPGPAPVRKNDGGGDQLGGGDSGISLGNPDSGSMNTGDPDSGSQQQDPDAGQQQNMDAGQMMGSCNQPFNGTLATWDFANEPGNQAQTAAKSSAPGVTAGAISRANSLTANVGGSSINASGWPTGSIDANRYYTLTIKPPAGCALDVTQVKIDTKTSATGPADGAIGTSDDKFATAVKFTPSSVATVGMSVKGSNTTVEIRIYGYTAGSAAGTMRVQNQLSVVGALK